MKIRTLPKPRPEIPQAPVADVAFLLLIFFLASAQFATEFGIPLQLPGIGSVKVRSENVLAIRAAADGRVYVREQEVGLRRVRDLVAAELAGNPQLVVLIETAADAPYERMVDVLDEVKSAQAERISIKKVR